MRQTFTDKVELEQLRAIETAHPSYRPDRDKSLSSPHAMTYEQWLSTRRDQAREQPQVAEALHRPRAVFQQFQLALWIVTGLLGFSSVSGLLSGGQQVINVFWLLGALLGANAVTLLLWLMFVVLLRSHNQGMVAGALDWVLRKVFIRRKNLSVTTASSEAWFKTQFSGSRRTWRFSVLSHSAWTSFLMGNIIGLLLVFTTQRYDFTWESTLLGEAQFSSLTQTLAWPMTLFGWPAQFPDTSAPSLTEESLRRTWAWFVILCLALYGLVPRVLALFISHLILHSKQRRWNLDFSTPYYAQLRDVFRRQQIRSTIIDADSGAPNTPPKSHQFSTKRPPDQAHWYGLEVDPAYNWQSVVPEVTALLNAPQDVEQHLPRIIQNASPYVIFVESGRTADRGVLRNLQTLQSDRMWLAVVSRPGAKSKRTDAWLEVAAKAGIDHNRCILVEAAA